jgi:nucleoside-diphosphate-sugar epimerase
MKILVSGSEGFVGKVLVANLLASGHEIDGIDRAKVANHSYSLHRIDLRNEVLLDPASYDVVIHCAAAKGDWDITDREFFDDNVVATENLLNYVRKCEVKKIIHFSTVAIYSRDVNDGSESTKIEPDSVYGRTKLDSEILIIKYAEEAGIPTVVLRPSVIYGRNNYANMFNLIQQLNRALPFQINPVGITKSHVSVRNVVDVVLRFSDPLYSVNGLEIYNLTERPYYDLNNMIGIICDELGVQPPKVNMPIWLVSIPFGILEFFGKLLKKDTGFTLDRLYKFSSSTHYTSEKLWSQIGKQKYSTESELRDMVKWFKERKNDTTSS